MAFLLSLSGVFKGFTGFIGSIATAIWNIPVLRYGLIIAIGLLAAFYYGGHLVAQRDAALAKEQSYRATIEELKKTAALQHDITAQNAVEQAASTALSQKQAISLQAYKDYISSITQLTVKGNKNAKNPKLLPPCSVDQRLLDAIGMSK
jgi:hypothetical protein